MEQNIAHTLLLGQNSGRVNKNVHLYSFFVKRMSGMFFDFKGMVISSHENKQIFVMCLMSCGNVSSLSLPRSNEKEAAAANRLRSARFWQESSTNAGQDANGPCFPPAMDQKLCPRALPAMEQSRHHGGRFFASFLLNMGKRSASTPNGRLWTAPAASPDALSKISD